MWRSVVRKSSEMNLPNESLAPTPWTRVTSADDPIVYERTVGSDGRRALVRLQACRTSQSYPSGSGNPGWTLRVEKRLRETSSTRSFGHASSRSEAVRSTFAAMRTVNSVACLDGERDESVTLVGLVERLRDGTARRRVE
jgi:hypothetical protein